MDNQSNQTKKHPRSVIYLRVARQADNNDAIASQRQACERLAAKLGATIGREYVEYGSASTMEGRPVLQRMLDELKVYRNTRYVIAYDHARLARNAHAHQRITWAITAAGADLVTVTGTCLDGFTSTTDAVPAESSDHAADGKGGEHVNR